MSLPWRKDKRAHLRLVRIEEKLDELIQLERGLIPFSNDPTELNIAAGDTGRMVFGITKQKVLHSWMKFYEDEQEQFQCITCQVLLTDCGATRDSWYCQ